jgi:catalase
VLAADGVDTRGLAEVRNALTDAGLTVEVVAPRDGSLSDGNGGEIPVDRTSSTTASVLYDGVVVAGGADSVTTVARTGELANQVVEAYKHAKPIGAFGEGVQLLGQLPLPGATLAPEAASEVHAEAGVVTLRNGGDLRAFADAFVAALAAPSPLRPPARRGRGLTERRPSAAAAWSVGPPARPSGHRRGRGADGDTGRATPDRGAPGPVRS